MIRSAPTIAAGSAGAAPSRAGQGMRTSPCAGGTGRPAARGTQRAGATSLRALALIGHTRPKRPRGPHSPARALRAGVPDARTLVRGIASVCCAAGEAPAEPTLIRGGLLLYLSHGSVLVLLLLRSYYDSSYRRGGCRSRWGAERRTGAFSVGWWFSGKKVRYFRQTISRWHKMC